MHNNQMRAVVLLLLFCCACGSNSTVVPLPKGPGTGSAGSVLIGEGNADADHVTDTLWVGFNHAPSWQQLQDLRSKHGDNGTLWIGGSVVVDSSAPLGFYFNPDTTVGGEVTAEGAQTTLDFIKADPATFAHTGFGNPIIWYVPAFIQQSSKK